MNPSCAWIRTHVTRAQMITLTWAYSNLQSLISLTFVQFDDASHWDGCVVRWCNGRKCHYEIRNNHFNDLIDEWLMILLFNHFKWISFLLFQFRLLCIFPTRLIFFIQFCLLHYETEEQRWRLKAKMFYVHTWENIEKLFVTTSSNAHIHKYILTFHIPHIKLRTMSLAAAVWSISFQVLKSKLKWKTLW